MKPWKKNKDAKRQVPLPHNFRMRVVKFYAVSKSTKGTMREFGITEAILKKIINEHNAKEQAKQQTLF